MTMNRCRPILLLSVLAMTGVSACSLGEALFASPYMQPSAAKYMVQLPLWSFPSTSRGPLVSSLLTRRKL